MSFIPHNHSLSFRGGNVYVKVHGTEAYANGNERNKTIEVELTDIEVQEIVERSIE